MKNPAASLRLVGVALALCAAAACSRDLAVPALVEPPQLASISPRAAFAGGTLTVAGRALGSAATASVFFAGVHANVLPEPGPDGALLVEMPSAVPVGQPLAVRVVTSVGEATLPAAQGPTCQGLGHPASLTQRATLSLGGVFVGLEVADDRAFALDQNHSLLFAIDPVQGNSLTRPVFVPTDFTLSFGTSTSQWVYASSALDVTPTLRSFDFSALPPGQGCPRSTLPVSATSRYPPNGGGTANGTSFVAPAGDGTVVIADLSTCPPSTRSLRLSTDDVPVQGAWPLLDGGLIAFTEAEFIRVPPGPGAVPVASAPFADDSSVPDYSIPVAPDPAGRRLAFTRSDGYVGLVSWDAAGGAPQIFPQVATAYHGLVALSFNHDGSRLWLVDDSERVTILDAATLAPVASLSLDRPQALAPLPGGGMLVGSGRGTALVSDDGVLLRTHDLSISLPQESLAVSAEGLIYVPTLFGAQRIDPVALTATSTRHYFDSLSPADLDGVTSSEGGVLGWEGETPARHDEATGLWTDLPPLPAGRIILDGALSADGKYAALISNDPSELKSEIKLDLVPLAGGAISTLTLPSDFDGLLYDANALWLASGDPGSLTLQRYLPGTLTPDGAPIALDRAALPGARVQGIWRAPGLGGVVVALGQPVNPQAPGGLLAAALLVAARPDGSTAELLLPPSMARVLALSADGRLAVSGSQGQYNIGFVDAMLLDWGLAGLQGTLAGHVDLSTDPARVAPSPSGDRLYITEQATNELVVVQ